MSQEKSTQLYFIIYKITNLLNKKIYIGKHITSNLDDGYYGSGKLIIKAIKKYGKQNFKKEILFLCQNQQQLNQKQKELVNQQFIKQNTNYNLTLGGTGSWHHINQNMSAEQRKKRQINGGNKTKELYQQGILKPYIFSEEEKEQISLKLKQHWQYYGHNWIGKQHKEETKLKISISLQGKQKGQKNSQYGTCWIHNEELKESKKIKKQELQSYLQTGWIKGRKLYNITDAERKRHGNSVRGKIWITNGKNNKSINKNDIIPDGWHKGRTVKRK